MILVVEDDPQVARLIALVLGRNGYESEVVADGQTAMSRARTGNPEMIFADLSIEDAARALGVGSGTVKRDFAFGRAWLLRELGHNDTS